MPLGYQANPPWQRSGIILTVPDPQPTARYAEVIVQVDAPGLTQPFTYAIPLGMDVAIGDAIMAPFGSKPVMGYVVGLQNDISDDLWGKVKPIIDRIEHASAFDQTLYDLARWVADDTFTDIRDTIRLIAPEIMASQIRSTLKLADDWEARLKSTRQPRQIDVARALAALGGSATTSALAKAVATGLQPTVDDEPQAVEDVPTLFDDDDSVDNNSPVPPGLGAEGAQTSSPSRFGRGAEERDGVGSSKLGPIIADLRRKGVITEEHEIAPPKARPKVVRVLMLAVDHDTAIVEASRLEKSRATKQASLVRALVDAAAEAPAGLPTSGLAIAPGLHAAARALSDKGIVSYLEVPVYRNPFRMFGEAKDGPPPLTDAQRAATETIGKHIADRTGATLLLHGVTGSGKTEVYLDAVARAMSLGRTALVLVPEIGLTAQLLDLFKARFEDDQVAVLHSALSHGERHDEWQRIKNGTARVVLGARSAAFCPLSNIGLIVIDEEHDGSYKQDNAPRYHARDAAQRRAKATGAVVVLGSATPSLESFFKAKNGEYELISLTERIDSRPLPPVEVVDLRAEFGRGKRAYSAKVAQMPAEAPGAMPIALDGHDVPLPQRSNGSPRPEDDLPASPELQSGGIPPTPSVFSKRLVDAITQRLDRGEQTILFLNRRGFATFLLCRDCGHTPACPNCDISLTYHHGARTLQCHHCDFQRRAPDGCPKCDSLRIRPFGLGTEKVEDCVKQQFPEARLLRMDRDTMSKKGAHADALRTFRRGEADILIGTQIVAKGLDFPNVTLVGVVSADTALNVPDFRSGERAFQLLTQVAGRAGRGRTPGEVIIQTFNPEHDSIVRATQHDYLGFFDDEIAHRQELQYPPFSHMANLIVTDPDDRHAQARIEYIAGVVRESIDLLGRPVHLLGPAACPLSRLKNRYRWHMVLRTPNRANIHAVINHAFRTLSVGDRNCLSVDIDPLTML